ncbi:MAG: hemerythrin domain-containing protein [Burkholderiales bacterium]|nr:hemerythrin domain-containing protein [Burkholderiales bacterium]
MDLARHTSRRLHEEHLAVLALLERFERALHAVKEGVPPADPGWTLLQGEMAGALQHEITRHFVLEEETLFPRLREYGAQDLVELLLEEHQAVREVAGELLPLLARGKRGELDAEGLRSLRIQGLVLVERLGSHASKEQESLVPLVDEMLDEETDMEIFNAYAMA